MAIEKIFEKIFGMGFEDKLSFTICDLRFTI